MSVEEAQEIFLQDFQSSHGDLFPLQRGPQPAVDSLEAFLSGEGRIYIPWVFEEPAEGFLLGLILLQQRQQSLLLLTGAIHEVIPWLYEVSVGAGFGEDGWDGRVTAYLQVIFGAFIPLQKIRKKASVLLSAEALLAFGSGSEVRVADGLVDIKLLLFGGRHSLGRRAGQGGAFALLYQDIILFFVVFCQNDHLIRTETRGVDTYEPRYKINTVKQQDKTAKVCFSC